jgi:Fe-Mn family superoxide dismutase
MQIISTTNQDSPYLFGYFPLISIDIWEHAYFLDYQTDRRKYTENLLDSCLNWKVINQVYHNIKK